MNKAKNPLVAAKKILEQIARKEGILPVYVNRIMFRAAAAGIVSDRDLKKLGGFNKVKDQLFPAAQRAVHPLADKSVHKMQLDDLLLIIRDHIQKCADSLELPPHELTASEFFTFIRRRWGEDNMKIAKNTITRAGGFNAIKERYFPTLATPTIVSKVRLKEHQAVNARLGTEAARQQFTLDRLEEFAARIFSGKVSAPVFKTTNTKTQRILTLILSDLHIGSDIKASETGRFNFSKVEESRRLAYIVKQVAEYKSDHRGETKLKVLLLGDIIQGLLHSPQDGAILSEQMARAIHILSQALGYLAASFKDVEVICLTGNHGRTTSKHPNRAIHDKFDSNETMIYVALKYALKNLPNVKFTIPLSSYHIYDVFEWKFFATHGDTCFSVGTPQKAIPTGNIARQINKFKLSCNEPDKLRAFIVGHIHEGHNMHLPKATVFINGAMCPPDPFAISIGEPDTACGQQLLESTAEHPVGDNRFIDVDHLTDRDESLDQIIQPWQSF